MQSAAGPRDPLLRLRLVGLNRHGQRHELVFKLAFFAAAAVGLSGELVHSVSETSEARGLSSWWSPAWRCEDGRLELLESRTAALECSLHCLELSLEEALLDTGRVGHLQQTLLEPGLVGSDLHGERVELTGQLAR